MLVGSVLWRCSFSVHVQLTCALAQRNQGLLHFNKDLHMSTRAMLSRHALLSITGSLCSFCTLGVQALYCSLYHIPAAGSALGSVVAGNAALLGQALMPPWTQLLVLCYVCG
jgi:hypothetical protein